MAVAGCARVPTILSSSPTPTPTATPQPAPEDGAIEFGLDYTDDLTIVDPRARFKRTFPTIAWVATLSEPADATSLLVTIARVTGASEESVYREEIETSNPDNDTFAVKVDLAGLIGNAAGRYVMRYIRDGDVLAEGEFELTR